MGKELNNGRSFSVLWSEEGGDPGAPPGISGLHIPGERRSRALPARLGPRSSSVSSKLPAAKPAAFTIIRVACKPRCQISRPRDSQLAHPQLLFGLRKKEREGWKQEARARGSLTPPLSPPQRQEFLGWADGPPPLAPSRSKPEWVGRGKSPGLFRLPAHNPECPHTVATGVTVTEWISGTQGWRGLGEGWSAEEAAVPPRPPQGRAQCPASPVVSDGAAVAAATAAAAAAGGAGGLRRGRGGGTHPRAASRVAG